MIPPGAAWGPPAGAELTAAGSRAAGHRRSFQHNHRTRPALTAPASGKANDSAIAAQLVHAMWEAGVEPGLERQRARLHIPGAVLLLGVQQKLGAAFIYGIAHRQPR